MQNPERPVSLKVEKGCITLQGCVPHYHQKAGVDEGLRRLAGVTDIGNPIAVKLQAPTTEVKDRILAALKRSAKGPTRSACTWRVTR